MNAEQAHFRLFFLPLPKSTAVSHHGQTLSAAMAFAASRSACCPNPLLSSAAGRSRADSGHTRHQKICWLTEVWFQEPETLGFISSCKASSALLLRRDGRWAEMGQGREPGAARGWLGCAAAPCGLEAGWGSGDFSQWCPRMRLGHLQGMEVPHGESSRAGQAFSSRPPALQRGPGAIRRAAGGGCG